MRDITEILLDYDRDWSADIDKRDKCIEDRRFVDVHGAQWEGDLEKQFKGRNKITIDRITRELNRIIGDAMDNPFVPKFIPDDDKATKKNADTLQSRFRSDMRKSGGEEAVNNATMEAFKGGIGGWRLTPKYEDDYDPDYNRQYICFEPIYDYAARVVWDRDSIRADRSDAKHCMLVYEMSTEKFNRDYPGKVPFQGDFLPTFFNFSWYGRDMAYIAEYFEVVEKKKKRIVFETPEGETVKYFADDLERSEELTLETTFYEQVAVENVKVRRVERALLCGDSFLEEPKEVPGTYIPIVQQWGYYSVIQGEQIYFGEVRKQRDAQVFNNMAVTMLGDTLSASTRQKPIFDPTQMDAKTAEMWRTDNVEDHAYLLAHSLKNPDGSIVASGPTQYSMPPQVPPAIVTALQYVNESMGSELANPEPHVPANTAAAAIQQVHERSDMGYFILNSNRGAAMRHCGRVWLSMAQDLYAVGRKMRILGEDGSSEVIQTMKPVYNPDYLKFEYENDFTKGVYEVITESAAYTSRLESEMGKILGMMQATDTTSPTYAILQAQMLQRFDGEGGDALRKYARFQELELLMGKSPLLVMDQIKNDEEQQFVMQLMEAMQQPPPPDPMMLAAQAEQTKAQAALLKAQNDQSTTQLKAIDTQSQAALREAQTVETYAKAQEINNNAARESMRMVADIRASQRKDALQLAQALRG